MAEANVTKYSRIPSKESSTLQPPHSSKTSQARRLLSLAVLVTGLFDFIVALLALAFIVFAALAYVADGKATTTVTYADDLVSASKYGPTIFPILFAAIVGRSVKLIASWQMEKGSTIRTLDQLMGSRTIVGTLLTQWNVQSFNALAILLIALWSLSPLGGQASLRLVSIRPSSYTTSLSLKALNFDTIPNNVFETDWGERSPIIIPLFGASLLSSKSIKVSPRDMAGNAKIPLFEATFGANQMNGWKVVSDSGLVNYSSLMGIPISSLPENDMSSFIIPSSYMFWDCSKASHRSDWPQYDHGSNCTATSSFNTFSVTTSGLRSAPNVDSGIYWSPASPRLVTINGISPSPGVFEVNCYVTETYVEANVSCIGQSCTATEVRLQPTRPVAANWTMLDIAPTMTCGFMTRLINSSNTQFSDSGTPTLMESFLASPDDTATAAAGFVEDLNLETLTALEMSHRVTQLFNTFWLTVIAPMAYGGDFIFNSSDGRQNGINNVSSTAGRQYHPQQEVHCDRVWFAVLVVASSVMFLVGSSTAVLGMSLRTPDILDSVSSLTRDNPYIMLPPGVNSTMDSSDRVRAMRDIEVRLGDVASESNVGHVALAAVKTVDVVPLKNGRLYD